MTPSAKAAGGRRRTRWTRETVIEKIREWNARYGEPPTAADWNPSLARWRAQEWRIERYRAGDWPAVNAAKRPFDGSFSAAVRAAGLTPHGPGPRPGIAAGPGPAVAQRHAPAPVQPRAALVSVPGGNGNGNAHAPAAPSGRLEPLSSAEVAILRDDEGPSGPTVLAIALRHLARARASGERAALHRALSEVAAAAVRWRDRL